MPETFLLEVATPERLYVREQVEEAQVPAANGFLGLLPGHAALLTELGSGELTYYTGTRQHTLTVEGGWLEVSENRARVLATTARAPEEE